MRGPTNGSYVRTVKAFVPKVRKRRQFMSRDRTRIIEMLVRPNNVHALIQAMANLAYYPSFPYPLGGGWLRYENGRLKEST